MNAFFFSFVGCQMLEHDLSNLKTSPQKKLPADYEEIKEVSEHRSKIIQVLIVCAFTCGENVSMLHALFFVQSEC